MSDPSAQQTVQFVSVHKQVGGVAATMKRHCSDGAGEEVEVVNGICLRDDFRFGRHRQSTIERDLQIAGGNRQSIDADDRRAVRVGL